MDTTATSQEILDLQRRVAELEAKHPAVGFGGLQDASQAVAQLINSVIQANIVPKVSVLIDHLSAMALSGDLAAEDIAKVAKNVADASDFIPKAIAWLKEKYAPATPGPMGGPFRQACAYDQQHAASTSQMLRQLLAIDQAEAAVLNAMNTALNTLITSPGGISPDVQGKLTAELKASADKLNAAIAAANHPSHP